MRHAVYHEVLNKDTWHCGCGNSTGKNGFQPCTSEGEICQPEKGWEGNYLCECNLVFNIDDVKPSEYCVICKAYLPLEIIPEGEICKKHFDAPAAA
jgi:hypothetical protein